MMKKRKAGIIRGTIIIGLVVDGWLSIFIYSCTATQIISTLCAGLLAGWTWQLINTLIEKRRKNKEKKEDDNE